MVQLNNRFQERPLVQRVLPLTPLSIYMDEVETEFQKAQERHH